MYASLSKQKKIPSSFLSAAPDRQAIPISAAEPSPAMAMALILRFAGIRPFLFNTRIAALTPDIPAGDGAMAMYKHGISREWG
jgi:hypothetical protein